MKKLIINFVSYLEVEDFMKNDRADGVKCAWYFYHTAKSRIMALDTKHQHEDYVNNFKDRGITLVKTKTVEMPCWVKCKSIEIEIYKHEDNKDLGLACDLAVFFDYQPTSDESTLIKVSY